MDASLAKPMLEGNKAEHRATDRRTLQLEILHVANPTIAAIRSIALAFVQSVFLVAAWDTSTKKSERQLNLAFEISFLCECLISGKLAAKIFLRVQRALCNCWNVAVGAAAIRTNRQSAAPL